MGLYHSASWKSSSENSKSSPGYGSNDSRKFLRNQATGCLSLLIYNPYSQWLIYLASSNVQSTGSSLARRCQLCSNCKIAQSRRTVIVNSYYPLGLECSLPLTCSWTKTLTIVFRMKLERDAHCFPKALVYYRHLFVTLVKWAVYDWVYIW